MGRYTKWLGTSLLLIYLGITTSPAAEAPTIQVRDFKCGLVTKFDSTQIGDGCAQDLSDVDVHTGRIETRRGSILQNDTDTTCTFAGQERRFLHEYIDASNNFWLISVTSNSICASADGGVNHDIITSTHGVSSTSEFRAVNAFGNVYLLDGTTNWLVWDGLAVEASTIPPKGQWAVYWFERLWTSVGSVLYASAFGDAADWTDSGISDDDAFSENINLNDGYDIQRCVVYKNSLICFKDYSITAFTMSNDGLTPIRTNISNTIGTQHPDSIVVRDNDIIFLGPDNYYQLIGMQVIPISEHIKPTIDTIQQLSSFSRSITITTEDQFGAATLTGLSSSISPGDVVLSTWTDTDTSAADFAAGALTNLSTSQVSGLLQLKYNNGNVLNNGFESCTALFGVPPFWSGNPFCATGGSAVIQTGSYSLQLAIAAPTYDYFRYGIYDYNLNITTQIIVALASSVTNTWDDLTLSMSSFRGQNIALFFILSTCSAPDPDDCATAQKGRTDLFYASGTDITFSWYLYSISGQRTVFVDDVIDGRSTIFSGSFTSQTFDTGLSSPSWQNAETNIAENGNTISYQTQTSTNGTNWEAAESFSDGTKPTSSFSRYIRYLVQMSTATGSTGLPYISDMTFAARQATGTYKSEGHSIGSNATSWGPINISHTLSTGTITYALYTDTDTASGINVNNSATYVARQTIVNLQTPDIAIQPAAYLVGTFNITDSDYDPTLHEYTLNWNEGDSSFPLVALDHEGDYICAVAISSATGNDVMLVYDRNGSWTYYNYPAYYMTTYRQNPYFGSNLNGDIVKFQVDDLYIDYDDSAISPYWISKDFDFGAPVTDKTITRVYITGERRADETATLEYGVNQGTLTSSTLDLDEDTGKYFGVIIPPSLTYSKGILFRVKLSQSSTNDKISFDSLTIKARGESDP